MRSLVWLNAYGVYLCARLVLVCTQIDIDRHTGLSLQAQEKILDRTLLLSYYIIVYL